MHEDLAEAFRCWRERYSYPASGIEAVATLQLASEPSTESVYGHYVGGVKVE